jgi:hypothetical protein
MVPSTLAVDMCRQSLRPRATASQAKRDERVAFDRNVFIREGLSRYAAARETIDKTHKESES